MSAITYIAKRNIELNGFSASGIDISAATSDDSFNSVTTDLSGSLNDEWIYVTGFTETANNGWFQVNGTPTTTKIIQDTSSLTTEAAGDAVVITGYKRGYGQSYSFDIATSSRNRSVQAKKTFSESLNGTRETLFNYHAEIWSITLAPVLIANMSQIREFLESCMGGESFTFDPYGTVAVPDDPKTAELDITSYNETEIDFTGYVRASFSIKVIL